jgi:signal transduction histidine kinase
VFLPGGRAVGAPAPRSAAVDIAATGRSLTASAPDGREILLAVGGLAEGTAVIRTLVTGAEMHRGVGHAWTILGLLGFGLLTVSTLVAYQLARTVTRPLTELAALSHRLAAGDLAARADTHGPAEVRQVSAGMNLLATRIGELLAAERERVADLSHRLRTPMTALRIDAESLPDPDDRARVVADVNSVDRTVNALIHLARSPVQHNVAVSCDAAEVVHERVTFWAALAEEEARRVDVWATHGPLLVKASRDDLAASVDALLGNVFAHTPEGAGMRLRLERASHGGAVLTVSDEGPGLPGPLVLRRGHSGNASTGLGLDIVHRVAAASGGTISLGHTPTGGARITMTLGAAAAF